PVAPAAGGPLIAGVVAQAGRFLAEPLGMGEGLSPGLAGLFARLIAGLAGALARGFGRFLGAFAGCPGLVARLVPGLAFGPPHLTGGPGQFLAEAADGVPDVLADLADDVADGRGQFLFELIELVPPVSQLLAAGLGDPVDLAPVFLVVRDQ